MRKCMEIDSFILILRHFNGRMGNLSSIRSDNRSNFAEAERELANAVEKMSHNKIQNHASRLDHKEKESSHGK